ncbi:MAG: DUF2442 domain-containing protein [Candidatus Aminicenantes bacterium]|nr:DUF2442 domain-containing protein [Candidatus Aminicenantes bacterium]
MRIIGLTPKPDWTLAIVSDDGRKGIFNVAPYLEFEAFSDLKNADEFMKIINGGYFVEWECGADLSADTIEAKMRIAERTCEKGASSL